MIRLLFHVSIHTDRYEHTVVHLGYNNRRRGAQIPQIRSDRGHRDPGTAMVGDNEGASNWQIILPLWN